MALRGVVLQCQPLLKQLERLHMLLESLFHLEHSGPQILCIPDSRTLRVTLESPPVLSVSILPGFPPPG